MSQRRTFIFMGVSGSGKSTIGRAFAEATGGTFLDGDDFHPAANIEKMSKGTPLDDEDREGWLAALRDAIAGSAAPVLCVACSALKEKYREVLRTPGRELKFIYLHGSKALLEKRLSDRSGHFMPPGLLESQLADLQVPTDAITVDISGSPDEIVAGLCKKISL